MATFFRTSVGNNLSAEYLCDSVLFDDLYSPVRPAKCPNLVARNPDAPECIYVSSRYTNHYIHDSITSSC